MSDLDICRLCAEPINSLAAISLFERKQRKLLQQVQQLIGLTLTKVKNLPEIICNACEKDAEQAINFRTRCHSAQLFFKSAKFRNKLQLVELEDMRTLVSSKTDNMLTKTENIELETKDVLQPNMVKNKAVPATSAESLSLPELVTPGTPSRQFTKIPKPLKSQIMRSFKKRKKCLETESKDLICDRCGNHFNSRHHFAVHLRRHLGDKRYHCELCSDKFFTNSELKRHMRKHTGEKPFACSHCNRCFTDYSTRIKHERTHTNERPFKCTHCIKAFTTSYILKNHLLTHTGERSFKCTLCNKSFQRQTNLVTHYRSIMHKQNEQLQQKLPDTDTKEHSSKKVLTERANDGADNDQ